MECVLQQVDEFIDHFQLLLTPKKLMVKIDVSSSFFFFFFFFLKFPGFVKVSISTDFFFAKTREFFLQVFFFSRVNLTILLILGKNSPDFQYQKIGKKKKTISHFFGR